MDPQTRIVREGGAAAEEGADRGGVLRAPDRGEGVGRAGREEWEGMGGGGCIDGADRNWEGDIWEGEFGEFDLPGVA